MKTSISKPDAFDIELLEAQGGNISPDHFDELLSQLEKNRSLDHANQGTLRATLGELDIVYVVLCKGYLDEMDENDIPTYTCVMKGDVDYWLAGLGCLRVGNDEGTAELVVSLLPRAQNMGHGRFLVEKLVQYAFDTLRLRRITASVVCPVQPNSTVAENKQVLFSTKQLCWMFGKFGFKFEGITRGAIKSHTTARDDESVWHDVHRMSMLDTDYVEEVRSHTLSNTGDLREEDLGPAASPWESMIQRQEEEKRDLESWFKTPSRTVIADDAYGYEEQDDEEQSDEETILGGDDDNEWEMPEDFED
ncbi:unnamed protein product [Rhizoctonia solani]|uniref:N-acetyltransferase domain-containing protein n=1 Tax=Rhizoctonia solani TaxID=456999 RepID=A0A8H3HEZ9_9AGAM|nr:unnamed protein product [Rhizoctonia solani]